MNASPHVVCVPEGVLGYAVLLVGSTVFDHGFGGYFDAIGVSRSLRPAEKPWSGLWPPALRAVILHYTGVYSGQ